VQLIVEQGPDRGRRLTAARPDVVIGRDPTCDVVLSDAWVSGRHAHLRQQGSAWWIADLGSANGTWIKSARRGAAPYKLPAPYPLRPGDQLGLGRTVLSGPWSTGVTLTTPQVLALALCEGLMALASLLLIGGAWLPWVRVRVSPPALPLVGQVGALTVVNPLGISGLGTYTMLAGGLTLILTLITLLGWAAGAQGRLRRLWLRWGAAGHLFIASAALALMLINLVRYYRSATRQVFLGIHLNDLVGFVADWLHLKLTPQIGLVLTGLGLLILLLGAGARAALAVWTEQ